MNGARPSSLTFALAMFWCLWDIYCFGQLYKVNKQDQPRHAQCRTRFLYTFFLYTYFFGQLYKVTKHVFSSRWYPWSVFHKFSFSVFQFGDGGNTATWRTRICLALFIPTCKVSHHSFSSPSGRTRGIHQLCFKSLSLFFFLLFIIKLSLFSFSSFFFCYFLSSCVSFPFSSSSFLGRWGK